MVFLLLLLVFFFFTIAFPVRGEVEDRRWRDDGIGGGSKVGGGVEESVEGVADGLERVKVREVGLRKGVAMAQSFVKEGEALPAEHHRLRVVSL